MSIKLYVGNLPYNMTEEELNVLFAEAGNVVSAKIITDRQTGQPRGFGFVEMESKAEGQKAISMLNGRTIEGRPLTVNEARPQEKSFGGGGGGRRAVRRLRRWRRPRWRRWRSWRWRRPRRLPLKPARHQGCVRRTRHYFRTTKAATRPPFFWLIGFPFQKFRVKPGGACLKSGGN